MRNPGVIEYITPLQMATESSAVPKSVMKTTVGCLFACGSCACVPPKKLAIDNKAMAIV